MPPTVYAGQKDDFSQQGPAEGLSHQEAGGPSALFRKYKLFSFLISANLRNPGIPPDTAAQKL